MVTDNTGQGEGEGWRRMEHNWVTQLKDISNIIDNSSYQKEDYCYIELPKVVWLRDYSEILV